MNRGADIQKRRDAEYEKHKARARERSRRHNQVMAEQRQQVRPRPPRDYRVAMTVILPLSLIRRLEPYARHHNRSKLIEQAITAALDQADQDREVKATS